MTLIGALLPQTDYWHRFVCRPCTVHITGSDSLIKSSGSFSIFLSVCGVTSLVFQQGSSYDIVRNTVLLSISLSMNLGRYRLCHGVCTASCWECTCTCVCVHNNTCKHTHIHVHPQYYVHLLMCACVMYGMCSYACRFMFMIYAQRWKIMHT